MQLKIIWISVGELQRRGSPTSILPFTDPGFFTAGNLHNHLDVWRDISPYSEVISWLENDVNIQKYFRHFKV